MLNSIYIDNKYTRWYLELVDRCQKRKLVEGYVEKHHIIPRSCGGSNETDNLVILTAREHFIAHLILTKCMKSKGHQARMVYAFNGFCNGMKSKGQERNYKVTSRIYDYSKKIFSETNSRDQTGEGNHFYGKNHSQETKDYLSKVIKEQYENGRVGIFTGKKHPEEILEKIRLARSEQIMPPRTNESKKKVSDSLKNQGWYTDGIINIRSYINEVPAGFYSGMKKRI